MSIITRDGYDSARELVLLAGLKAPEYEVARRVAMRRGDRPDLRRAAVHETGHAAAYLAHSVRFVEVHVDADGKGGGALIPYHERPHVRGPEDRTRSLESRIDAELGGVCAEQALMGWISPWEIGRDVLCAVIRADGNEGLVRERAKRLLSVFAEHRKPMEKLAAALGRAKRLQRADCVSVVRRAGWDVDEQPRFEPVTPPSELTRLKDFFARSRARAQARADATQRDAPADNQDTKAAQVAAVLGSWSPMIERKIAAGPP